MNHNLGACVGIPGSVFPHKDQSDVMGPGISLFWHETDVRVQALAARTYRSLKVSIKKFEKLYSEPIQSFEPGRESILGCPYPRSYTDLMRPIQ